MRRVLLLLVIASIIIPAGMVQAQEIVTVEGVFTLQPEGTYQDDNIKIIETTEENSVVYEATAGGGPATGIGRLVTISEVTQGGCVQTYRSTFVVTYTGTWEPQSLSFTGTWTATFDHELVSQVGDCDGTSYGKTLEPLSGEWNAPVEASSGTVTDKKVNYLPILSIDGDLLGRLVNVGVSDGVSNDSTAADSSDSNDESTSAGSSDSSEDGSGVAPFLIIGVIFTFAILAVLGVVGARRRAAMASLRDKQRPSLAESTTPPPSREHDVADYLRDAPGLEPDVPDVAPPAEPPPDPVDTGPPVPPDVPSNLDPDDVIGTFLLQLSVVATVNRGADRIISESVDRLAESYQRLFPNGWSHLFGTDAPDPGDVIEGAARGDQAAVDQFVERIQAERERHRDVADYPHRATQQPAATEAPAIPPPDDEPLGDPVEEVADPFAIPPIDLGMTWRPNQEPEPQANPWKAVDQRLQDIDTGSERGDLAAEYQLVEDVITSISIQASALALAQQGDRAVEPEDAASRLRRHIEELQETEFGRKWRLVFNVRNSLLVNLILFAATGDTHSTADAVREIQEALGGLAQWDFQSRDAARLGPSFPPGLSDAAPDPERPQPDPPSEPDDVPQEADSPPPLDDGGIDDIPL